MSDHREEPQLHFIELSCSESNEDINSNFESDQELLNSSISSIEQDQSTGIQPYDFEPYLSEENDDLIVQNQPEWM